jgi:hypothetical protein
MLVLVVIQIVVAANIPFVMIVEMLAVVWSTTIWGI